MTTQTQSVEIVDAPVMIERLRTSQPGLRMMIAEGRIPPPLPTGRRRRTWIWRDVVAHLERRADEAIRRGQPA